MKINIATLIITVTPFLFVLFFMRSSFILNVEDMFNRTVGILGVKIVDNIDEGVKSDGVESFMGIDVTLDSIFTYESSISNDAKVSTGTYVLIATGDVVIGRSVNFKTVSSENFELPYEKIVDLLKSGDVTFINFESPLVKGCPVTVEGMVFCGDERNVEGLKFGEIDVVNLANNHIGNYGKEGIENTVRVFTENGILFTGLGNPTLLDVRGKKFGFLGYNEVAGAGPYIPYAEPEVIEKQIRDLNDKVDYVIVAFHWGIEYTTKPSKNQVDLAHLAVDFGADLVIGNHPHWVQGVEIYKDRFISYAHGNFIFDQMWSLETREGVVGKYIFNDNGLVEIKYYPIIIEDYNQPRFATEEEAKGVLLRMKNSSLDLVY